MEADSLTLKNQGCASETACGQALLEVCDVKKYYGTGGGLFSDPVSQVRAVDGVSFEVQRGETLGLVGESGCGKTTIGRVVLGLTPPTEGRVVFEGKDLSALGRDEKRQVHKDLQIVFQDPYSSLNPRLTVEQIIGEGLEFHGLARGAEKRRRVGELLETVRLHAKDASRFPHEFSGGQRQRIGIARAIALEPKLIICDEPVSALDVSIQSQILRLLTELQERLGLTYVFIAHGLNVVRHISDRVAVMYLGKIVEICGSDALFDNPRHPYTQALLSAIPIPDPTVRRHRIILEGDVPSPINPPSGCRFHTRCSQCRDICREQEPPLRHAETGRSVACHLV